MAKADNNRGAMRGKKTSKGLAATDYKDIQKLTTGRAKAITRNVKIEKFGSDIAKGKNKNFVKNTPKLQRKYDNLRSGSNTLSPSSLAKFPKQTKPVPVKPRGGRGMSGGAGLSIGKVR